MDVYASFIDREFGIEPMENCYVGARNCIFTIEDLVAKSPASGAYIGNYQEASSQGERELSFLRRLDAEFVHFPDIKARDDLVKRAYDNALRIYEERTHS